MASKLALAVLRVTLSLHMCLQIDGRRKFKLLSVPYTCYLKRHIVDFKNLVGLEVLLL